jgi:methylmalonyl-CoA mutase N-terminal domain/subunit
VGDAARSESGQPVQAVYGADALDGFDLLTQMGYDSDEGIDSGVRTVVGVNKFAVSGDEPYEPMRAGPQIEADQCQRLAVLRAERDNQAATRALSDLRRAADGNRNVLPPLRDALALRATGGEIAHALRDVWGVYQTQETL